MNVRRNLGYAAICTSLLGVGAGVNRYVSVIPLQSQVTGLEQRAAEAEKHARELQNKIGQYSVRLSDRRIMRLNPDMSVTMSGINGDNTSDMEAGQYRTVQNARK